MAAPAAPGKRSVGEAFCWFLSLAAAMATPAAAAVYKVGDSAGWTIIGDVNYSAWAASKTFRLGDSIVFVYNKQFHNVAEVSKAEYRACTADSPLATHTSGNDTVELHRRGHRFFICGVPGHCALGQKVDIRIPKIGGAGGAPPPAVPAAGTLSSPPAPSPAPGTAAAAPGPRSNAAGRRVTGWCLALVGLGFAAAGVGLR